ncbi:MAG: aspartate aminotransferase family protein [Candidatus Lokiarchaeota archaeon]|nr:aspartate aminotransferase family protein [Candidatus Lokiarchaeota archaeon]
MNEGLKNRFIGTLSQKELLKLYAKHVNSPKVRLFKGFGLGVILGERKGVKIKTLAGPKPNEPSMELYNCHVCGGVYNLGHGNQKIVQILKDALDSGLDIGDHLLLSEWRALLGEKIAGLMPPGITKTTFGVSGGEAVDSAIKFSRAYTKRKKCISAIGGFHGHTGFALAAGDPGFKENFLWNLSDFKQVPFGDIDALKKNISDDVACIILETIPASAGVLIAQEGYFSEVRELCDDFGVMMIIDEVQAGLGRTGHFWAIYGGLYEHEKVIPDFMVLGKGMSAGIYPITTCSYKPFIEKAVFKDDPFIHISTTGGSDLGCVIACKMLDIQSDPKFLNHVTEMGKLFGKGLEEIADDNSEIINGVRGRGLMWGMEFNSETLGQLAMLSIIKEGVLQNYCGNKKDTLIMMPPLIVKEKEIEEILKRIREGVKKIKHLA